LAGDHEWVANGESTAAFRPPSPGGNGRIVLELFWEAALLACQNFALLCSNPSTVKGEASGKPLTYKGSKIHRVVPGFVVQGGDIVFGNGSGGESAVVGGGKKFKDERGGLVLKHDRTGVLSMGNSGKNSNTSQFFITLAPAPQCDGKHVVFGRVVSGFDVLEEAEKHGAKGGDGTPTVSIVVTDCGLWYPLQTPGAGYWYDKPDPETYAGFSPVFVCRPRVAVVAPSHAAADRFRQAMEPHCCVVSIVAIAHNEEEKVEDSLSLRAKDSIETRLDGLLRSFAVDVAIVAPACKDLVRSHLSGLPERWTELLTRRRGERAAVGAAGDLERVVLDAKPADALKAVRSGSWIHDVMTTGGWTLDDAH
jgi:cyclophilin family peptidyl-prolyl cis-trans isomerase